jgi:hypothetical protein
LEIIDKIIPNTTKRDVFVFSVYLYGYYDCSHLSIDLLDDSLNDYWDRESLDLQANEIAYCMKDDSYPLFFDASKVYNYGFKYNNEQFYLSFQHKPTIVNYWHFQIYTCDDKGNQLPREADSEKKESKSESKKLRHIALTVFEYILSEAICAFHEVKKYQNNDFDRIISSFPLTP